AALAILVAVAVAVVAPLAVLADQRAAYGTGRRTDRGRATNVRIRSCADTRADRGAHGRAFDAVVAGTSAQSQRSRKAGACKQAFGFAGHVRSPFGSYEQRLPPLRGSSRQRLRPPLRVIAITTAYETGPCSKVRQSSRTLMHPGSGVSSCSAARRSRVSFAWPWIGLPSWAMARNGPTSSVRNSSGCRRTSTCRAFGSTRSTLRQCSDSSKSSLDYEGHLVTQSWCQPKLKARRPSAGGRLTDRIGPTAES